MVHIITSSRYVKITPDFLRRIFSLMGNILSFILDPPEKYKKWLFLETDQVELTSMVYVGENVLVIECKNQIGCRVLLNRADLIQLQYLEWIYESVSRKSNVTKPAVLRQFDMFLNHIDQEFTKVEPPPRTNEEMITFIKNLHDDHITTLLPKNDVNFISQLKKDASTQLADHWARRWIGEMSPELFTESEVRLISPLSPPRYSSMSPMLSHDEEEDPLQARGADEERGIIKLITGMNPTQATWAPIQETELMPNDGHNISLQSSSTTILDKHSTGCDSENFAQYPPWYTTPPSRAVDENEGPTSFNHSPSSPLALLGFTGQKLTTKSSKRNVKRKLCV